MGWGGGRKFSPFPLVHRVNFFHLHLCQGPKAHGKELETWLGAGGEVTAFLAKFTDIANLAVARANVDCKAAVATSKTVAVINIFQNGKENSLAQLLKKAGDSLTTDGQTYEKLQQAFQPCQVYAQALLPVFGPNLSVTYKGGSLANSTCVLLVLLFVKS